MGDGKRLHRDDPGRTGPIRDFSSGLYHEYSGGGAPKTPGAGASGAQNGNQQSRNETVGLAYRIIEKHISDGKRNAGNFNARPYALRTVTDGFQELAERTLRFQTEMLPLWLEVMGSAIRIDPARMPYGPPGVARYPESNGAERSESKSISLAISSSRPAQVSIDLREGSQKLALTTLGLRAVEPDKPVLNDVSLEPETPGAGLRLRIAIPENHPAGTYSGVIVNRETGEVRGTLSVRIAESLKTANEK